MMLSKASVIFRLYCIVTLVVTLSVAASTKMNRARRNNFGMDAYNTRLGPGHNIGPMDPTDEEKLDKLYGRDMVDSHRADFEQVRAMGESQEPMYHPRPPPIEMPGQYRQTQIDETHNNAQNRPLTPALVRNLLQDLLDRLNTIGEAERNLNTAPKNPAYGSRCSLHGLWISAVTGVAFQLQPVHETGHHTLHVQVVDSGEHFEAPFITGQWSGTAQVSPEIPTTISIILQEQVMEHDFEPKTAVFVGQCAVCTGSPTIQGTWILFPKKPTCFQEPSRPPQSDVMYLLAR